MARARLINTNDPAIKRTHLSTLISILLFSSDESSLRTHDFFIWVLRAGALPVQGCVSLPAAA
jgi:hypothetical protein